MATVIVEGLPQIQRDIARSGPAIAKALRLGLREAAEPVKRDAERLSVSQIRRMGATPVQPPPWSLTRVGVTSREVYIVPKERGVKSRTDRRRRRPNLVELMLGRSFEPALERNTAAVQLVVDRSIQTAIRSLD